MDINIDKCPECGHFAMSINFNTGILTCLRCFREYVAKIVEPKQKKVHKKRFCIDKKTFQKYCALVARSKKKEFDDICSLEEFVEWYKKTPDICHYCKGKMKEYGMVNGDIISIDRRDNKKGYIVTNMVKACYTCNDIKGQYLSEEQMIKAVNALFL